MEVLDVGKTVLSNCEVLKLLQEIRISGDHARSIGKSHIPLATITYENAEIVSAFLKEMEQFPLTKMEKLLLLNLRPTTPVEIQLIVQDSDERLSEEQVEVLIALIDQHLPAPTKK